MDPRTRNRQILQWYLLPELLAKIGELLLDRIEPSLSNPNEIDSHDIVAFQRFALSSKTMTEMCRLHSHRIDKCGILDIPKHASYILAVAAHNLNIPECRTVNQIGISQWNEIQQNFLTYIIKSPLTELSCAEVPQYRKEGYTTLLEGLAIEIGKVAPRANVVYATFGKRYIKWFTEDLVKAKVTNPNLRCETVLDVISSKHRGGFIYNNGESGFLQPVILLLDIDGSLDIHQDVIDYGLDYAEISINIIRHMVETLNQPDGNLTSCCAIRNRSPVPGFRFMPIAFIFDRSPFVSGTRAEIEWYPLSSYHDPAPHMRNWNDASDD